MASSQATNSPFIQIHSDFSTAPSAVVLPGPRRAVYALSMAVAHLRRSSREHRRGDLLGRPRRASPPPRSGVRSPSRERRLDRLLDPRSRRRRRRARRGAASPPRGTSPAGWRSRCPAMSGAEPWTGSKTPGPSPPRLAEGSIPSEPVSIAASSQRMSPNMFSVTITSKRAGVGDELHRRVVDEHVLELDVGVVAPRPAPTVSRHRRDVSRTFALSTEVTWPRAPAGRLEGDAGDPLDLGRRVDAGVAGASSRCASSRRSRCRR